MRNRYTAVVQRDGKWFIAFCPEVPEANGQGKTREDVSKAWRRRLNWFSITGASRDAKGPRAEPNKLPFWSDETSRSAPAPAGARLPAGSRRRQTFPLAKPRHGCSRVGAPAR